MNSENFGVALGNRKILSALRLRKREPAREETSFGPLTTISWTIQ